MARVRKNVLSPAAASDVAWYARAVAALKNKRFVDPTSWRFQAAIHEYVASADPLASPGDPAPPVAIQTRFWTQCQHGSWYFLPWHRMYLHHFEMMLLAEIQAMNGPGDWALPYWNYSKDADARLLPPPFRRATQADGSPNPLYVAARAPGCNAGQQFAGPRDTDLSCLREPVFQGSALGGSPGFGGPVTKWHHDGGAPGALEATPHGNIHNQVGGRTGWMSAFDTAALDPIFWLHHANIDRLWEVWLERDASHKNPVTKGWLTSVAFEFHDASGNVVSMTPSQVIDTTAAPLSYEYDDTSDPLAAPAVAATTRRLTMAKKKPPEMVGATEAPLKLRGATTHAVFSALAAKPAARAATRQTKAAKPRRVLLNIENLSATDRAPSYDVYFNVPDGADPHEHEHLFVGRLSMFGLAEASRAGDKHTGSGLHYVLDVTDLFERLSSAPGWDPGKVRVSFVPTDGEPGADVSVGRVSLYFE